MMEICNKTCSEKHSIHLKGMIADSIDAPSEDLFGAETVNEKCWYIYDCWSVLKWQTGHL